MPHRRASTVLSGPVSPSEGVEAPTLSPLKFSIIKPERKHVLTGEIQKYGEDIIARAARFVYTF